MKDLEFERKCMEKQVERILNKLNKSQKRICFDNPLDRSLFIEYSKVFGFSILGTYDDYKSVDVQFVMPERLEVLYEDPSIVVDYILTKNRKFKRNVKLVLFFCVLLVVTYIVLFHILR